jgi:hypothetical protein
VTRATTHSGHGLDANSGAQVAMLGADDKVVLKSIQLSRDFGDSVEVIAGLAPETGSLGPPESLQSGDTVRVAAVMASPNTAATDAPKAPASGD